MTQPTLRLAVLICASLSMVDTSHAAHPHAGRGLLKMEPRTRSLQICANKGSREISREKDYSHLDRVVVDAMSTPSFDHHVISGTGGAFRQKGQWRRFQFTCTLAPDEMSAMSFTFQVGDMIPESRWEEYGLWP